MIHLKALGGLRLDSVQFTQPKPLLLLTYLAVEGGQQRKHLAELFWQAGDRMKSLGVALVRLRQGLSHGIESDGKKAWATVPSDVKELLEALDKNQWQKADELYTGAFLEGVMLEPGNNELEEWVYSTREYLAERVQHALLNLAEDAARNQDFAKAGELAERAYKLPGLAGTDLTNLKRLYALLCASDSLRAPDIRKEAEGYGVTLRLTNHEAKEKFKLQITSNTLPVRNTSFVGRDEELAELATLLSKPNVSLLALLGPAGVGKTRLALQLAHEQQKIGTFKDGVYFVPLDALTDSSLIPSSLLSRFGLTQQGKTEPLNQLTDFLAEKNMLLVLDNFEHLNEGSSLLSELLNKCPKLILLVTTRERLNLEEEHVFALEGLPYPPMLSDYAKLSEAVQLFIERAQQIQPRFDIDQHLGDVLKICQLVEGLPLGIELSASWVRLMSCKEIVAELERGLEFLSSTSKNIPERHRSLKAAFEQSWKLLTLKEQEVLRKLSVFVGGFRREAASEVAGATIPILASLVDKSLLKVFEGRYGFHPLLQQYALERLKVNTEEANDTQANHADFFVKLAESVERELKGKEQKQWLARLEQEHDNFRSVLAWALQYANRNTKGLRLAGALERFWYLRGYLSEGREWLARLLANDLHKGSAHLKALFASAWLALEQGDYEVTRSFLETCIRLGQELQAKDIVASSLRGLGSIAHEYEDYATARNLLEQSLALERDMKNSWGISACLNNLGLIAYSQEDYSAARTFHEESLAIKRKLGDDSMIAASLHNLGIVALDQGDTSTAQTYFEEVLAIREALGDMRGLAMIYINLGGLLEEQGEYAKAKQLITESLKIMIDVGHRRGVVFVLASLASLAMRQKEFEQVVVFSGTLERVRKTTWTPLAPADKTSHEQNLKLAKVHLGDEVFTKAWEKGRSLELEQVLKLVLASSDSRFMSSV